MFKMNQELKLSISLILVLLVLLFSCDTQAAGGGSSSGSNTTNQGGSSGGNSGNQGGGNSGGNSGNQGGSELTTYTLSLGEVEGGQNLGSIDESSTKSGSYNSGEKIMLLAKAGGGNSFLGWYDSAAGDVLVSGDSKYEFRLTKDRALYAKFGPGTNRCSFITGKTADSTGIGSISAGSVASGIYSSGRGIKVEAITESGNSFLGWYDSLKEGKLISIESTYKFVLTKNRALYARFSAGSNQHSLSVDSNGIIKSGSTSNGIYKKGTMITLEAATPEGSRFIGWLDTTKVNTIVSTNIKYSFPLNESRSLYAKFELVKYDFTTAIDINSSGRGSIDITNSTPNGKYSKNELLTVIALPDTGSRFVGWIDSAAGGKVVSTELKYSLTIDKRTGLLAQFELIEYNFALATAIDSNGRGGIDSTASTPKGKYPYKKKIKIKALADSDSKFIGWYDAPYGGKLIVANELFNFDLVEDTTLYAKFQLLKNEFSLDIAADGTGSGTISSYSSSNGRYDDTTKLRASASVVPGSRFSGWYDAPYGGTLVSKDLTYEIYITKKTTLYAKFDLIKRYDFAAAIVTGSNGSLSSSSTPDGNYEIGTTITVEALSNGNTTLFLGWYDSKSEGNLISGDAKYTFSLTKKTVLYGRFGTEPNMYDFSVNKTSDSNGLGGISAISTANGSYKRGTTISIEAIVDKGCDFIGWYDAPAGGNILSRELIYRFNLTKSTAIYAKFNSKAVTFIDPILENLVRKASSKPKGELAYSDVAKIKSLTFTGNSYSKISNLSGIEYLTGLTTLSLSTNQIENLKPLKNLTNLKELVLTGNQISDLAPLKGLKNISKLYLNKNSIEELAPLKSLANISELNLSENVIKEITPLTELTKITKLNLNKNQIVNITALKKMTNMLELNIDRNKIVDIGPLEGLIKLTTLNIAVNKVTSLSPISRLNKITSLDIANTGISDISPLANLTEATHLYLYANKISNLRPLAKLIKVTYLDLYENEIGDISALNTMTGLYNVDLRYNNISDLTPLINNTGITAGDVVWVLRGNNRIPSSHFTLLRRKNVRLPY